MPLIASPRNTNPEHAYTHVNLMVPTNNPATQPHSKQISNQDITLLSFIAILFLLSGAAIIRLTRLLNVKKDTSRLMPTSHKLGESSSSLPLAIQGIPRMSSPKFRLGAEDLPSGSPNEKILERDITFSFPFTRPDSPQPVSPPHVPAFLREEEEDIAAMLSIRAGEESIYRRGHREKKESESSTATTVLDSLCSSVHQRSSITSVYTLSIGSEADEEEEIEEVEVKRAQTQSMEFKRGVLMSWRTSRPPSPIPEMPTVVISESSSDYGALDRTSVVHGDDSLLQALPSLLVTHPSDISLVSSSSSASVDLDEFPLPPTLPIIECGQGSLMPDTMKEDKRWTVDQVIKMCE
ncbi:hypothetical protein GYMLUDRAFT_37111 [Collybiopsis luxurians FD-317 M1]|nr:hypothetical protein GYMLUDRAFT_37111 [Collybiopsis luxurians FD-317 M1]